MTAAAQGIITWAEPILGILWLPVGLAAGAALLSLVLEVVRKRSAVRWLIAAALGAAALLSFGRAMLPGDAGGLEAVLGIVYAGGGLSALAGVVYTCAALSVLSGFGSIPEERRGGAAVLVAAGAAASQVLLGAVDLVIALLALEMLAVVSYALVAAAPSRRAHEAAVRYAVQGGAATGLLVLALAVLAGAHGAESSLPAIAQALPEDSVRFAVLGAMLLVSGLAFKAGAFPFHAWVPDAYETAPHSAATFLAVGPKSGALGALMLAVVILSPAEQLAELPSAFAVIALGSLIIGTFGALRQHSLTRMLGYSAVAQAGYAFIALQGDPGTIPLFAATYSFGTATAFLTAEAIARREPSWDGRIAGLAGLSRRQPWLAATLAIAMLSLTGIPLTAGFTGKLFVFLSVVGAGKWWLAAVGALASVVSFGYYGAVVRAAFLAEVPPERQAEHEAHEAVGREPLLASDASRAPLAAALLAALGVMLLGIAPISGGLEGIVRFFGL